MDRLVIQIADRDNVAVAIRDLQKGEEAAPGVIALENIPQAHKIALVDIPEGAPVLRYGVELGTAARDIRKGEWVNEENLVMAAPPDLDRLSFGTKIRTDLPEPKRTTWMGYRNPDGGYGGTRNILGINTTVQCVTGVLNAAVKRIREELLPKYPNVDDVVVINHQYGCGVAIDAPEAYIPQKIIRNIARHPNFGGVFMLVSLGCEKFTPERFCEPFPELNNPDNVLVLQDCRGHDAMMAAILEMADRKLQILNRRKREELPLSDLLVGMQCGGSDAFSGITANPTAGYAADLLVAGGGTAMFSEVTEVRDGVPFIAERCISREVGDKLVREMKWYDDYLKKGGVGRDANTTPGNHRGGLSNIVEKSMGSIAKSGSSPIVEVLSPGDRPTKHGEIFAATPASDLFCGPSQLASGMGLEVFMTGRGTPYGLAAAPVIKVCSRTELKEQWPDIIDFDAGPAALGKKTIAEQGEELFSFLLDVASGKKTYTEQYGFANDICIFNPAPIT